MLGYPVDWLLVASIGFECACSVTCGARGMPTGVDRFCSAGTLFRPLIAGAVDVSGDTSAATNEFPLVSSALAPLPRLTPCPSVMVCSKVDDWVSG